MSVPGENGGYNMARQQAIYLSTIHAARGEDTVWHTSKTGDAEDFNCPPYVPNYQQYMGGVDLADQRIFMLATRPTN